MPFRFTMLCNVPNGGFSETWYNTQGTSFPVPPGNPFDELALRRQSMLSAQGYMIGWRLIDIDNPRQGQVKLFPKGVPSDEIADTPTNSWMATVKGAGNVGKRQLWIRGVADDMIAWSDTGKRFVYDATFGQAWTNYKNFLLQAGAGWAVRHVKSKKEQPGGVFDVTAINSVGGAPGTTLTAAALVDGNLPIVVAGFKKPISVLNGTYLPRSGYLKQAGGVVLVGKTITAFAGSSYAGGATVRQQEFSYASVADIQLQWARERRVGRAFFELRGRRSRR